MACQYSVHGHPLRIAPFPEADQQFVMLALSVNMLAFTLASNPSQARRLTGRHLGSGRPFNVMPGTFVDEISVFAKIIERNLIKLSHSQLKNSHSSLTIKDALSFGLRGVRSFRSLDLTPLNLSLTGLLSTSENGAASLYLVD